MPQPARRVAVATSGGRDSTALLYCARRVGAALGIEVIALHVHHGLVEQADEWVARLQRQCRRWQVPLAVTRLAGAPARGDSVEAWARRERYAALARMARDAGCSIVLLAHHRRDQAETFLLQALRGAGAAGLAAMPRSASREGLLWARPWLGQPRVAIEAYVRRHRLAHVDDPSNHDPRFARGRLRQGLWAAFERAFPEAEGALAAAALQAAGARELLAERAVQDLARVADGDALQVEAWRGLSPARRANALRAWLADAMLTPASETLVQRLLLELEPERTRSWPVGPQVLRLYRGQLRVAAAEDRRTPGTDTRWFGDAPNLIDLSQAGWYRLEGWSGRLQVCPASEGGVAIERLRQVALQSRVGGERFRFGPRSAARSLKKQYQARAVPAWQRAGPLLYTSDGRLLFVPGLGVEGTQMAEPGAAQCRLDWVPDRS